MRIHHYPLWLMVLSCAMALAKAEDNDEQIRLRWHHTTQQIQQQEQDGIVAEDTAAPTGTAMLAPTQAGIHADSSATAVGQALLLAINHQRWPQVRQLLAVYEQYPDQDASLSLFAQASLAGAEGRSSSAQALYQSLLQHYPGFLRARLDYARLLFQDNQMNEAKVLFHEVLAAPQLPDNVRLNVRSFVDAAHNRTQWHGVASLGRSHNTNVNQGAGKSACFYRLDNGVCWVAVNTPQPIHDSALTYDLAVNKLWQVSGHHYVNARGLAYGYVYDHQNQYSEDTALLQLGYSFQTAANQIMLSPLLQWGRLDSHVLYQARGARLEWQHVLGQKAYLSSELSYRRYFYRAPYAHNDNQLYSAYIALSYLFPGNYIGFVGADYAKRESDYPVNDYDQRGMRLGVSKRLGQWLSVNLSGSWRQRQYAADSAFWGQRKDTETILTASVKSPRMTVWGVAPVLSFKHTRNRSSADTYFTYRQNELSLKLEKTF